MRRILNELLIYISLTILVYLGVASYILLTFRPNFAIPQRAQSVEEPEPIDPPQADLSWLSGFIQLLLIVLLVVALYFIFSFIQGRTNWGSFGRMKSEAKSKAKDVQRVKDARIEAFQFIEKGLQTQEYRNYYLLAYLALDEALNSFREISRPKHWTPKEYAYRVNEPIFQPSVFAFVSRFYDYRYGGYSATQEDLLNFQRELHHLFVNEVPEDEAKVMIDAYQKELQKIKHYKIISSDALIKPRRND